MPRGHFVKKARKKNPAVRKGQSYCWWKFNFGPKVYSKTYPKRSQLTRSEFLGTMYDLEDRFQDFVISKIGDLKSVAGNLRDIASDVQTAGDDCSDRRDNMPESLQDADAGQLLEARSGQCAGISQALETAADEIDELVQADEKDDDDKVSEEQSAVEGVDWSFE